MTIHEDARILKFTNGERPKKFYWVFHISSNEDISENIDSIKSIVSIISKKSNGIWPEDEEWKQILPVWFSTQIKTFTKAETDSLLRITPREK